MTACYQQQVRTCIEGHVAQPDLTNLVAGYLFACVCKCHSKTTTADRKSATTTGSANAQICKSVLCPTCNEYACSSCTTVCHCGVITCFPCSERSIRMYETCNACGSLVCAACSDLKCKKCDIPQCTLIFCNNACYEYVCQDCVMTCSECTCTGCGICIMHCSRCDRRKCRVGCNVTTCQYGWRCNNPSMRIRVQRPELVIAVSEDVCDDCLFGALARCGICNGYVALCMDHQRECTQCLKPLCFDSTCLSETLCKDCCARRATKGRRRRRANRNKKSQKH
jgi:hypothetical protein